MGIPRHHFSDYDNLHQKRMWQKESPYERMRWALLGMCPRCTDVVQPVRPIKLFRDRFDGRDTGWVIACYRWEFCRHEWHTPWHRATAETLIGASPQLAASDPRSHRAA